MSAAGGFLARWPRHKRAQSAAAKRKPAAQPPPDGGAAAGRAAEVVVGGAAGDPAQDTAPAHAAAALPPLEALTPGSDFSAFLRDEVGEALRRQALKKLFADPRFNRMDGLDVYIDDYSLPAPIPAAALARLRHARALLPDGEETEAGPTATSLLAAVGERSAAEAAAGAAADDAHAQAAPVGLLAAADVEGAAGAADAPPAVRNGHGGEADEPDQVDETPRRADRGGRD